MAERILICGDRHWDDCNIIEEFLAELPPDTVIIEGEARGADKLARLFAEAHGLTVERYPADWERYGRAAGPIRNRQMLTEGKPTRVVAFHNDIERSKGTKNMIEQAKKAGLPTEVRTAESRGFEPTDAG